MLRILFNINVWLLENVKDLRSLKNINEKKEQILLLKNHYSFSFTNFQERALNKWLVEKRNVYIRWKTVESQKRAQVRVGSFSISTFILYISSPLVNSSHWAIIIIIINETCETNLEPSRIHFNNLINKIFTHRWEKNYGKSDGR